jgi:serine/threonine-protein kinase
MSDARERWHRIEAVFEAVLLAPEAERPALLDQLAADDDDVRREAASLLHAHEASSGFLEATVSAFAAPFLPADLVESADDGLTGDVIDRYRLVKQIGHGGGGEVYLAERADGQFEHGVAL